VDLRTPEPGGKLNHGEPTVPRAAATVILLRGGGETLEVMLVRRNPAARFMGGVWVFPGGAVEPGEGDGERALRAAAARELHEEAGIALATDAELIPFARWITPREMLVRFDTWFFAATAPPGAEPVVDGGEIIDVRWYTPAAALAAAEQDEIKLVFPTIRQLTRLAGYGSADALLASARGREVVAVEPRVVDTEHGPRVVLPDETGYVLD
jgi:8-oxo-dGTP pyrophosphatase MutT (NUDIX family)